MIDTIVQCPRLIVVPNNPSINRQGQVWNANELDHIVGPAGGKLARDTNDDPLFYDDHDALVVCITDASLTDTLVDVLVALGYSQSSTYRPNAPTTKQTTLLGATLTDNPAPIG